MRLRVSSQVDSHHTNPFYRCLIVEWLSTDLNFRLRLGAAEHIADWLPKDSEILELVVQMLRISPTFIEKLQGALEEKTQFILTVPLHEMM